MIAHEETERRYAVAHEDVVQAFDYYMTHCNAGRPFILAGHSQGAKAVIELLKHTLTPQQHKNMIAAYAFGFTVREQGTEAISHAPSRPRLSGLWGTDLLQQRVYPGSCLTIVPRQCNLHQPRSTGARTQPTPRPGSISARYF